MRRFKKLEELITKIGVETESFKVIDKNKDKNNFGFWIIYHKFHKKLYIFSESEYYKTINLINNWFFRHNGATKGYQKIKNDKITYESYVQY